ncbi:MAG TPA: CoA pyrophosphatase [Candidatus Bathyarchaeia archaeon]|nr:CoA pyrophosphatase [Candidatus Bathyarchaeia archaeon]
MTETRDLPPRLIAIKERLAKDHRSSNKDHVDAVVAVILVERMEDSGLNLLLIQRAERADDPWSGQIGLPGGRVKDKDSSVRSALRREVIEEVGIDLEKEARELGPLSLGYPMRRTELRVQPWVYGLAQQPTVTTGTEVSEAFWIDAGELTAKNGTAQVSIRGERREIEAYTVEGRIVWGFTHRVLGELLQIPEVTA